MVMTATRTLATLFSSEPMVFGPLDAALVVQGAQGRGNPPEVGLLEECGAGGNALGDSGNHEGGHEPHSNANPDADHDSGDVDSGDVRDGGWGDRQHAVHRQGYSLIADRRAPEMARRSPGA